MSFLDDTLAHFPQRADGDCLTACGMMALAYIGRTPTYRRLLRVLGTIPDVGTPFSNLRRLHKFGVAVTYGQGTLQDLQAHLANNTPCILSVDTGEFPYWQRATAHAVVLVGLDEMFAYFHDPDLAFGPTRISRGDLDLAWLEGDELFATLSRA